MDMQIKLGPKEHEQQEWERQLSAAEDTANLAVEEAQQYISSCMRRRLTIPGLLVETQKREEQEGCRMQQPILGRCDRQSPPWRGPGPAPRRNISSGRPLPTEAMEEGRATAVGFSMVTVSRNFYHFLEYSWPHLLFCDILTVSSIVTRNKHGFSWPSFSPLGASRALSAYRPGRVEGLCCIMRTTLNSTTVNLRTQLIPPISFIWEDCSFPDVVLAAATAVLPLSCLGLSII
nr:uncharacterized protein LOC131274085 [Dasypus novemcinctus]